MQTKMPNPNPAPKITKSTKLKRRLTPPLAAGWLHTSAVWNSTPRRFDEFKPIWGRRQEAATRTFWTLVVFWGFVFWGAVNEGLLQKETKRIYKGRIFIFMITIHDISWKESSLLIPSEDRCSFWVFHKLHLCRQPKWSFHSPLATAKLDPNGVFASKDSCLTTIRINMLEFECYTEKHRW